MIDSVKFLYRGKAGIVIPLQLQKNRVCIEVEEGDDMGVIDI